MNTKIIVDGAFSGAFFAHEASLNLIECDISFSIQDGSNLQESGLVSSAFGDNSIRNSQIEVALSSQLSSALICQMRASSLAISGLSLSSSAQVLGSGQVSGLIGSVSSQCQVSLSAVRMKATLSTQGSTGGVLFAQVLQPVSLSATDVRISGSLNGAGNDNLNALAGVASQQLQMVFTSSQYCVSGNFRGDPCGASGKCAFAQTSPLFCQAADVVPVCSGEYATPITGKVCDLTCQFYQIGQQKICSSPCPASYPYTLRGVNGGRDQCVAVCPAGNLYVQDGFCVPGCSEQWAYPMSGVMCDLTCQYYNDGSALRCMTPNCGGQYPYYYLGSRNQCLKQCPSDRSFIQNWVCSTECTKKYAYPENGGKLCDLGCQYYKEGGKRYCMANCQGSYPQLYDCQSGYSSSSCRRQCTPSCPNPLATSTLCSYRTGNWFFGYTYHDERLVGLFNTNWCGPNVTGGPQCHSDPTAYIQCFGWRCLQYWESADD